MITKNLEAVLKAAFDEAKSRRHEFVCVEHLLWVLPRGQERRRRHRQLRRRPRPVAARARGVLRDADGGAAGGRGEGAGADPGFSPHRPASLHSRPVLGEGRDPGERPAGGDCTASSSATRGTCSKRRTSAASISSTTSPTASPSCRRKSPSRFPGRTRKRKAGSGPSAIRWRPSPSSWWRRRRRGCWTRSSAATTRSPAPSTCCAGGARTTPSTWATRAWARPPSPRGWPCGSMRRRFRRCCTTPASTPWTWARCWPAPSFAASSRPG